VHLVGFIIRISNTGLKAELVRILQLAATYIIPQVKTTTGIIPNK